MTLLVLPAGRRARRAAARDAAERAIALVQVLAEADADCRQLAAAAVRRCLPGRHPSPDDVVRAVVAVAGPTATPDGWSRLALLLGDVEGRRESEVAELLGTTTTEVAELRAAATAAVGATASRARDCRGWGLVGAHGRLTAQERSAADAHLGLCRTCRLRRAEQQRTRERLLSRSAAVTATVVADVVALSLPVSGAGAGAGLAAVIAGKPAVAIVGAAAAAVAVASGGVALARHVPPAGRQLPQPVATTGPSGQSGGGGAADVAPSAAASPPTTAHPVRRHGGDSWVPAPSTAPGATGGGPLPTPGTLLPILPTALPSVLPTVLPTLLPTGLPTGLATGLPTTIVPTLPLVGGHP